MKDYLFIILIFYTHRKNSNRLSEGWCARIGIGATAAAAAEIFLNEMSTRSVRPANNRADRGRGEAVASAVLRRRRGRVAVGR